MIENSNEVSPVITEEGSTAETPEKRKERLEDEARWRRARERGEVERSGGLTMHQSIQSGDRFKTLDELISSGAVMDFDEEGNVKVNPTAEQITEIQAEWETYVRNMEARCINMSTDDLEKAIRDLQKPDRRRPAALGGSEYKSNPEGLLDKEQYDRAALIEVLRRRRTKGQS